MLCSPSKCLITVIALSNGGSSLITCADKLPAVIIIAPKGVLTELSLVNAVSKTSGDKFVKVKPRFKGVLSEEARRIAEMFAAGFAPKVEITADDYEVKEDGEVNESDE